MQSLPIIAKYPFLTDAKTYVQREAPSILEILQDPLYERSRSIAIERLENAFHQKDVGMRRLATKSDCLMELFSYPIARMIAVCVNDSYFTRRYALGEAVHMYKNLLKEPTSFFIDVAKEFDLTIKEEEDTNKFSLYFTDYLRYAPTRYKKWKMINRELDNGFISVSKKDLARLLQEALRNRINLELDGKTCYERVKHLFLSDINQLKTKVMKYRRDVEAAPIGKLDVNKLPPCLKQILSAAQAGENVPHVGRFALVAFLNSLQLSTDDILNLFSRAPDFEEERTRYQIEHITGEGSSTSYKAPGCEKLKTYGLCPSEEMDALCKKVHHPLGYYQAKWRKNKKKAKQ